jgi:hypothetical protein
MRNGAGVGHDGGGDVHLRRRRSIADHAVRCGQIVSDSTAGHDPQRRDRVRTLGWWSVVVAVARRRVAGAVANIPDALTTTRARDTRLGPTRHRTIARGAVLHAKRTEQMASSLNETGWIKALPDDLAEAVTSIRPRRSGRDHRVGRSRYKKLVRVRAQPACYADGARPDPVPATGLLDEQPRRGTRVRDQPIVDSTAPG